MAKMTEQEKREWTELYEYVKKILGRTAEQNLSRQEVLRLKGICSGKFMENKKINGNAKFSYRTVLNTFKFCSLDIQRGLRSGGFKNEGHKFNYVVKIVENNINEVYEREQKKMKAEKKMNILNVSSVERVENYKKQTEEMSNTFKNRTKDLW